MKLPMGRAHFAAPCTRTGRLHKKPRRKASLVGIYLALVGRLPSMGVRSMGGSHLQKRLTGFARVAGPVAGSLILEWVLKYIAVATGAVMLGFLLEPVGAVGAFHHRPPRRSMLGALALDRA
jgi:hypothetical protein